MEKNYKSLKQLFIPIFLETLFLTLVGSVDTMMLSHVNDSAVGGVGTANTYMSIFLISFSIISSGMLAVMTQYIGFGKPGVAKQAGKTGGLFNLLIGIVLSLVLIFFADPILKGLGISQALFGYASIYTKIVGGACVLNAIIPILNAYLRAFGYTKEPLAATVVSNVVNLALNWFFLYIMDMGVVGVALATVIARVVNLIVIACAIVIKIKIPETEEGISGKLVFKQIISIGFPAAMETALYNLAMTLVVMFLNKMDKDGLNVTARSYAMQITNFSYVAGVAMAQANAILTGWRIGEKKYDECHKKTIETAKYGIITAVVMSVIFAVSCRFLLRIFTDNNQIIDMVQKVFIVDIFLEIGRVSNLVYGNALKTCGDAIYTVSLAVVFMYLFAVLGTYILGLKLGYMIVGTWIALAMDECARGIFMYRRWNSRKWETKVLVK